MTRTALITGASRGIGRAFADLFAAHGYDLLLVARNRERLEAVAADIEERHRCGTEAIPLDLGSATGARDLHSLVREHHPVPDVLVNNAGIGLHGPLIDSDLDRLLTMLDLNVLAPTVLCRLFGRDMAERGSGRILNLSSTAAFQGGPQMAAYYATKAYLLLLSEGLRQELRPAGVTVTALCPGATRTEFFRRAGMAEARLAKSLFLSNPAAVAATGYAGLMKGRAVVIPGFFNRFCTFLVRLVPRRLATAAAGWFNRTSD
jgi:short-subunit dehydrogenase